MEIPLHSEARVVARHQAGLIAVDKPAGVRSHPNKPGADAKSLLGVPYDFEDECFHDGSQRWYLLNRLDAPTSGLILLATVAELARLAREAFAGRRVEKEYRALVRGRGPRREESWEDNLKVTRKGGQLRVVPARAGDPALTRASTLQTSRQPPVVSLLSLVPKTGRTHQLRVQSALRKMPIIGDATYGDFKFNRTWYQQHGYKRLYLHSYEVNLSLKFHGAAIHLQARTPIPEAFKLYSNRD